MAVTIENNSDGDYIMKKKNTPITRKEFLKKSSAGLLGAGIIVNKPLYLWGAQKGLIKNILGKTGIEVTPVGFGASRTQSPALTHAALDTGINFIDTGRSYANGQNEVMIGKIIKDIRKDLVIQSKVMVQTSKKAEELKTNDVRKKIREMMQKSLHESLKALQTDYIDIWLLYKPSRIEMLNHETVWEVFTEAKQEGKIRACGFSTHSNQVEMLKAANKSKFYDVIMVSYNHKGMYIHSKYGHRGEWDQEAVEVELKIAHKNNIGIIAMKTCSGGPYSSVGNEPPTFGQAVKWVIDKPYIDSAAVAMANFDEINEHQHLLYE